MSDPFIGEVRMFGGNFAPVGWLFCQGQLVSISDYDALFSLLGTVYGGDGVNTFALPNLQSRSPLHAGVGGQASYVLGQTGGLEAVTITAANLPPHTHLLNAGSLPGTTTSPSGAVWAGSDHTQYAAGAPDTTMSNAALVPTGGNQPRPNIAPVLAISFIISCFGVYPTPS
ncbi:phage tail protein [Nocardioides hwasunensis]|uniref:Phage tail protein n=1 Tax=Nocardioides hwasunensis TaxID=397258 RepID=A0ABR8MLD2_9ACTN|nr:tail fiber protein [Nocardioides hwasunensis]MBD3915329.1 phage tail protein [Nocardioides hwasunensis]